MDKNILVFGDSHTYGDGFDDCGHTEPWKQHSIQTWPYHMFDKKQISNFAYPGCSNDMMFLKLIRQTSKENIVLIMFSYPERQHITRNGYNFICSHNFNQSISDNGDENWVAKQLAEKFEQKNKDFIINHFDDNFMEMLFLKNILMCQWFCENNKIEHYFTFVTFRQKTEMQGSLAKYRDSLYGNINWKNIFLVENQYGFQDYAKKINATKPNIEGQHYGYEYNKKFGRLFLDWINKKKQV